MTGRTAPIIGGLALVFYLLGAGWGGPTGNSPDAVRKWGVDDESPLGPLAQVHNILEPKEFQNLGYPLMHSFLVVGAYAPYLGWEWMTGKWRAPSSEYPYGFEDPAHALRALAIIANILSAVMAAGMVWCAFDIGRQFEGEAAARLAAGMTAVSYPVIYYSRTGNVDVPMMFFIAAALAVFARCLMDRLTVGRGILLGAAVGFAAATKEPAAAAFLGVPVVLLVVHARVVRTRGLGDAASWLPFVAAAAACGIAFGLGSGLFIDPDRFFAHLDFIAGRVGDTAAGDVQFSETYPRTLAGHLGLARLLVGYVIDSTTAVGALFAIGGVLMLVKERSRIIWFAVPAATYYAVLFWSARVGQLRYLLPVSFVVIVFAAVGMARVYRTGDWGRRVAGAGALFILGIGVMRGVDLTQEMIRDSRYSAAAWLSVHLPIGAQVDFFGADQKLPAFRDDVVLERATEYLGAVMAPERGPEAVHAIEARWRANPPDAILVIPDHSTTSEEEAHSASLPPAVYEALERGRLGYTRAAEFQTRRWFPWLPRPRLDYPTVNPRIQVFTRDLGPREAGSTTGRSES